MLTSTFKGAWGLVSEQLLFRIIKRGSDYGQAEVLGLNSGINLAKTPDLGPTRLKAMSSFGHHSEKSISLQTTAIKETSVKLLTGHIQLQQDKVLLSVL